MKVLIIYFSQTGGTEKIARKIKDGIELSGNECELVPIKEANLKEFSEYDLIGLGCPTFYYREPINVKIFIQKLDKNLENKHCFLFCTHGSIIGNTFYHLKEELFKKGFLIIDSFDSYSESSLQFYPKIMHTANHPDEIELKEAEAFGKRLCAKSLKLKQDGDLILPEFELVENTWWARDSKLITPVLLRKISPKLEINVEKCTQCMTCQDNCPVNAISIEDPPEIQKEGCIYCWFCEKVCPVDAIEVDWSSMIGWRKSNLKRYIKALEEAEEQGKFRPYVDYRKINS